ncbi:MAG: alpha-amylase family glycosyl hydrolase [Fusobacteriota bacterium]
MKRGLQKSFGLILLTLIFALGGCFSEKESDKGIGVELIRNGDKVSVITLRDFDGLKLKTSNGEFMSKEDDILQLDINNDEYILAGKKTIKKGSEIGTIEQSKKGLVVEIKEFEELEFESKKVIKKASENDSNILLGDFNADKIVDLNDLVLFADKYSSEISDGIYEEVYDIYPSSKGTDQDWEDIYSLSNPDGSIDLLDFVILARNFNKEEPINNVIESIQISGPTEVYVGETINLTAKAIFTDGSESTDGITWSSNDESIGTVNNGTVSAISSGSIIVEAFRDGIIQTHSVQILEQQNGIAIHVQKPSDWGAIWIWYNSDLTTPDVWDTADLAAPPGDLENYRDGWYKKTVDSTEVEFLFNNGIEDENGNWDKKFDKTGVTTAIETTNFVVTNDIWITSDGTAYDADPVGPSAPSISITPKGGDIKGSESIIVDITGENISSKEILFAGQPITISSDRTSILVSEYLTEGQEGILEATATNTEGTTTKTETFIRNDEAVTDTTIHFRKPTDWACAYIHYWNTVANPPTEWTASVLMNSTGEGWYSVTLEGDSSASFLFKDAQGSPTNTMGDFSASGEVWVENGTSYDRNPDWAQPAVLSTDPAGGYFETTQTITLNIDLDYRTTLLDSRYTIDGSDPKLNGVTFNNGDQITIGSNMVEDELKTIKVWSQVEVDADGEVLETYENISFVKGSIKQPTKLGVDYGPAASSFSIWSPDTSDVKVKVNGVEYPTEKISNFDGYSDVYSTTVQGDLHLAEYEFYINGKSVRDPYGIMVKPNTNTNIVIDLNKTGPEGGWVDIPVLENREDAMLYEVHIRDLTIDDSSGVSIENKGKYLGMVETGTDYQGVSTGIDHLKELGVTHVQILPFYDFATEMYNWGYDPVNYNIPEEQYSVDPYDYVGRINEVKTMINEFHKNGIRVVMDVVYNHTYGDEMFQDITSRYYTGNDDSGTGNGIDTGEPMVSRMIQDSLEYWVDEYMVDGFRFDLAGVFYYDEFRKWGEHLNVNMFPDRNLIMHGEPWNGHFLSDTEMDQKVYIGNAPAFASGRLGVFNAKYREAIKGNSDGKIGGYMFNNVPSWDGAIGSGMKGSIMANKSTNPLPDLWDPMFAYDPEQSINYLTAHDNYGLWDKIIYTLSDGSPNAGVDTAYAERIGRFGMGMIFTSQGIPFLHGGEEILRSKTHNGDWTDPANWVYGDYGTHNTYNSPDSFNSYKWEWKVDNLDTFNYYKDLVQLRKENKALRLTTWEEINNHMTTWTDRSGQVVIGQITGVTGANDIMVVYNSGTNYTIDNTGWTKIFDAYGLNPTDQSGVCEGTGITVFRR